MQLTSDSRANSPRAATTRTTQGDNTHRLQAARPKADAKHGRMRAWLMRWVKSLRGAWRTFERFLSDYYRACGVVATATATMRVRCVYLRAGELLALEESHGWKTVEVVSGEMWLTQTPATNDLLLGPGGRFEVGDAFPVVIEALGRAEIVLRG